LFWIFFMLFLAHSNSNSELFLAAL
jgi:hypothetical protein